MAFIIEVCHHLHRRCAARRTPEGLMTAITRGRSWMAAVLAVALLSVGVVRVPAFADTQRPPRSANQGLVPADRATDMISTDIPMSPLPGESWPEFQIVGVQMAPMTKILRDGSVDPDNARAYWNFQVRFPRSSMAWPPFVPEPPNDPWGVHFFEMPDGGLTGIGISQGSPLYSPPNGLPGDWINRLVPAARAAIPASAFEASLAPYLASMVFGGHAVPTAVTAGLVGFMQSMDAAVTAGATADDIASLAQQSADTIASQLTVQTLGALLGFDTAALTLVAAAGSEPCFAATPRIMAQILVVLGAMVSVAVAGTATAQALFIGVALTTYGTSLLTIRSQITACGAYVEAANAAGQPELAALALSTSSGFVTASATALLLPWFVLVATLAISAVFTWWGMVVPPGLELFGLS